MNPGSNNKNNNSDDELSQIDRQMRELELRRQHILKTRTDNNNNSTSDRIEVPIAPEYSLPPQIVVEDPDLKSADQ